VASHHCSPLSPEGIAVVTNRVFHLICKLEHGLAASIPAQSSGSPPPATATEAASAASQTTSRRSRRASLTDDEGDDDACGSDSDSSLDSDETEATESGSAAVAAPTTAAAPAPAAVAAAPLPAQPRRRPTTVPVLPQGGGLALKVGPAALPLLRLLHHQLCDVHQRATTAQVLKSVQAAAGDAQAASKRRPPPSASRLHDTEA
jgi:hypothetical protein